LSPETCRADLKRLIKEKLVASCWLLMVYGHTKVKYMFLHTNEELSERSSDVNYAGL